MVVLKLAEPLREWTGLSGDPIQLAKAKGRWTAGFGVLNSEQNRLIVPGPRSMYCRITSDDCRGNLHVEILNTFQSG